MPRESVPEGGKDIATFIIRFTLTIFIVRNFVKTAHHDTYSFIDPKKADLSGKYVLVTGASSGCGRAMAVSYAKAGASNIAILARRDLKDLAKDVEDAATRSGRQKPKVLILNADVTNREQVEETARKVEKEFGRLDVLVNNAGYLEDWRYVADSDPDDWWKTWEVNIKGPYLMCRSFIPLLLKGGDKTIVQLTSNGGLATIAGASAYQGTKQAILRFNNFLRLEYGNQGLLAYSLHPGAVKTDLALNMPEFMHEILTDEPELSGDTVVWLTAEKRTWLQDRFISVVWDMEELLARKDEIEQKELLRLRLTH